MNQFIVHRTATATSATPTATPKIRHFSTLEAAQAALSAGDIEEGQIISVEEAVNEGEISQYTVPLGATMGYRGTTAPSGYLFCDGSEFDETKYPLLYALLGSNKTPNLYDTSSLGSPIIKTSFSITPSYTFPDDGVFWFCGSGLTVPSKVICVDENGTTVDMPGESNFLAQWYKYSGTEGYGSSEYYVKKGWTISFGGDSNMATYNKWSFTPFTVHQIIKAVPAYDGTQDQLDEAVASALKLHNSWTTDEVWTGGYYLGKKLYRKLVPVTSTITSNANTSYQSIFTEMDTVTHATIFGACPGRYTALYTSMVWIDTYNGNIWISGYEISSGYIAVEYTRKDEA